MVEQKAVDLRLEANAFEEFFRCSCAPAECLRVRVAMVGECFGVIEDEAEFTGSCGTHFERFTGFPEVGAPDAEVVGVAVGVVAGTDQFAADRVDVGVTESVAGVMDLRDTNLPAHDLSEKCCQSGDGVKVAGLGDQFIGKYIVIDVLVIGGDVSGRDEDVVRILVGATFEFVVRFTSL